MHFFFLPFHYFLFSFGKVVLSKFENSRLGHAERKLTNVFRKSINYWTARLRGGWYLSGRALTRPCGDPQRQTPTVRMIRSKARLGSRPLL